MYQHDHETGYLCTVSDTLVFHQYSTNILSSNSELTTRCGGIVEAFFQNLSPDEKELFKATTLAEHILDEVRIADKAHKEKSYGRKVSQALKPFLAGINQYGQALDVISNASSAVLSPLWGGVRIILHVGSYNCFFWVVF